MLLEAGLITEEQLGEALKYQAQEKERLGTTLVKHNYITEKQLIDTLRIQLGIEYIDLSKVDITPEMSRYVPKNLAKKMNVVPVRVSRDQLFLAMADPLNFMAIEEAKRTSKKRIVPMIASEPAVRRAINVLYGNEGAARAMEDIRAETAATRETEPQRQQEIQENKTPMIRLVNSIIERAVSENASDIHFEPTEDNMVIRMRIDGQLHRIMTIPQELKDSVVSRLKIMAKLDIVEKRIPQDGRAVLPMKGTELDMRTSTLPTIHGEKVVIRILRRNEETLNRRGIGIPASEDAKIDKLLGLTSGVIMIVGPTGSGKSSTMYTLIRELLSDRTNLITLEDPVEYHIDGATQVQINEKVGLTFACSPPLNTRTRLSICLVVSPHFARAERTSYWLKDGNSSQISSIQVFLFSPLISCSKYPISKFSPSSTEPPSDGINPKILFNRVVLPIPFAPTSAILCPRSMEIFNGFDSGSSYPITRSFVSKI